MSLPQFEVIFLVNIQTTTSAERHSETPWEGANNGKKCCICILQLIYYRRKLGLDGGATAPPPSPPQAQTASLLPQAYRFAQGSALDIHLNYLS